MSPELCQTTPQTTGDAFDAAATTLASVDDLKPGDECTTPAGPVTVVGTERGLVRFTDAAASAVPVDASGRSPEPSVSPAVKATPITADQPLVPGASVRGPRSSHVVDEVLPDGRVMVTSTNSTGTKPSRPMSAGTFRGIGTVIAPAQPSGTTAAQPAQNQQEVRPPAVPTIQPPAPIPQAPIPQAPINCFFCRKPVSNALQRVETLGSKSPLRSRRTVCVCPGCWWTRRIGNWTAVALNGVAFLSVLVLVIADNGPATEGCGDSDGCGSSIDWHSSLLYKLANMACSHVPRPLHRWAELFTMLGILIGLPVLLLELAAKADNWAKTPVETTEQWFWNEPCFFCGKPVGSRALQDVDTFALACPRCRKVSYSRRIAGIMLRAAAYLSIPFSFFGVWFRLMDMFRPLFSWADEHLVSVWWILLDVPGMLLFLGGVSLSAAVIGMVLLRNWAANVAGSQPGDPEFDGSQWHWNRRPLKRDPPFGAIFPPRITYGIPIQLPPFSLSDNSTHASREWERVLERVWEVRPQFPKLLHWRWGRSEYARDWSSDRWGEE